MSLHGGALIGDTIHSHIVRHGVQMARARMAKEPPSSEIASRVTVN